MSVYSQIFFKSCLLCSRKSCKKKITALVGSTGSDLPLKRTKPTGSRHSSPDFYFHCIVFVQKVYGNEQFFYLNYSYSA